MPRSIQEKTMAGTTYVHGQARMLPCALGIHKELPMIPLRSFPRSGKVLKAHEAFWPQIETHRLLSVPFTFWYLEGSITSRKRERAMGRVGITAYVVGCRQMFSTLVVTLALTLGSHCGKVQKCVPCFFLTYAPTRKCINTQIASRAHASGPRSLRDVFNKCRNPGMFHGNLCPRGCR